MFATFYLQTRASSDTQSQRVNMYDNSRYIYASFAIHLVDGAVYTVLVCTCTVYLGESTD